MMLLLSRDGQRKPDPLISEDTMGLLRWLSRPFSSRAVAPVMDDDHKKHFLRLSQLAQQIESVEVSGEPRERQGQRVLSIIRQLIDDGRVHFAREKELMDSYGYE